MTASNNTAPYLLLLDGHSLAYRAFYALPADNFQTANGQHTNAVYGFMNMFSNLVRDEAPTHVAVAFDVSRKTFRARKFPEYKAQRAKSPEEFKGQVALIQELLTAAGVTVLSKDDFEADDILATLASQAQTAGFRTAICTGDRDAIQLVTDHVTVLYPRKGTADLDRLTPDRVLEKYGLPPAQYPDMAALVGEKSDNIPGVAKVGEKTAIKWLTAHDGFANLLENADQIKGVAGANFAAMVDQVRLNRELNTLRTDVELPYQPSELCVADPDLATLRTIFGALEFRPAMQENLLAGLGHESATPATAPDVAVTVTTITAAQITKWFTKHPAERYGVVAVGAEAGQRRAAAGLALAAPNGQAAYLALAGLTETGRAAITSALHQVQWACHDLKSTMRALKLAGLGDVAVGDDVELMAYLVEPDRRSRTLADLAMRLVHRTIKESASAPVDQLDLGDVGDDSAEVACDHAHAVVQVHREVATQVGDRCQEKLLHQMELPLATVLLVMEDTGVACSRTVLTTLRDEFSQSAEYARSQACKAADREVNLASPKQLQEVLFTDLDMPKTRKIKTGYSTDAESLVDLYEKTHHPFLEHLLAHREVTKQLTTVKGLLDAIAEDGRIHTRFQQSAAATGRLSSTDPNLQNIPVRTAEGRRIRSAFVPGDGFEGLLTADYSQIEMRIMAHLCADPALVEAFRSGEDLHAYVGAQVFGVHPADVSGDQRAKVKAMSYGLAYGLSAFGLAKQLRISDNEAKELMTMYFERFGGVRDYLDEVVAQARKVGYTETIMGRRRYLPDLTSTHRQRRDIAERAALNAPIQGSAADIMKVAMLAIAEQLAAQQCTSRLLLQVHDEVIIEVAPGERTQVEQLVVAAMGAAAELTVPLAVNTGWGSSWFDAEH